MADRVAEVQKLTATRVVLVLFNDRTLEVIQQAHPGATVWFAAGSDKLDMLEQFVWEWDFLFRYRAVVFARNGEDVEEQLRDRAGLRAFRGSITVIRPPADVEGVSSTAVRAHLFEAETVADMLHPAVLPLLKALRDEWKK